jgi:Sulfotransferase family
MFDVEQKSRAISCTLLDDRFFFPSPQSFALRYLLHPTTTMRAKVNKRRRSISGDDVVDENTTTIGEAEAGQQNGHEKRRSPMIHHFSRSSSCSSSSFFFTHHIVKTIIHNRSQRPSCNILLLALLGIVFVLGSNIRNVIFSNANQASISSYFQNGEILSDPGGELLANGKRQDVEESPAALSSSSSSSSSSTTTTTRTQQCSSSSSNGASTSLSFGELIRVHYEKMHQQPAPALSSTLKFLHIAKTGGTAIEMAAAAANISWGVCHWHNGKYYKHHTCPLSNEPSRIKTGRPPKIAFWHKTSQHYDVRFVAATTAAPGSSKKLNDGNDNKDVYYYDPYANATLFAVVRNPYNRVISEYYYETSRGNTPEFVLNNATRLNAWVHQVLRPLQGATMSYIQFVVVDADNENNTTNVIRKPMVLPPNRNYYQRDSHYIPQYDYFYDGERRVAQHAIHFENLSHEFRALTMQYNLSQTIVLPDIAAPAPAAVSSNTANKNNQNPEIKMSGRHTQNKKLGLHNLTIENIRLVEFVYARDFVFFGYPARTHLLENHYQPADGSATVAAPTARHRRLEFVHIPQTGGRMIEMAAAAALISWGACHFSVQNQQSATLGNNKSKDDDMAWCPTDDANSNKMQLDPNDLNALLPVQLKEMKNRLWHLPSHYFEKVLSLDTSSPKQLHNPYGDEDNFALFVVVRNPYDRLISTYYSVHEQEQTEASDGMMMNSATYMNEWLYRHLVVMRDTISTERHVDATSFPNAAYYQFQGRFMPQYDFVYDFVYDGNQGQRRVVDHVLHFESIAKEFPALMIDYYGNSNSTNQGRGHRRPPLLPEINDPARLQALLECTESRSLGIANLTLENVRLIEFVYARDFAAFGYKSMTYHLENQYPINLKATNE